MLKCDNKSGGIYMKNNDFFLKYLPMSEFMLLDVVPDYEFDQRISW